MDKNTITKGQNNENGLKCSCILMFPWLSNFTFLKQKITILMNSDLRNCLLSNFSYQGVVICHEQLEEIFPVPWIA